MRNTPRWRRLRKILSCIFVFILLVVSFEPVLAAEWEYGSKGYDVIKESLPNEYRNALYLYGFDYAHVKTELIHEMQWKSTFANLSVATMISYLASAAFSSAAATHGVNRAAAVAASQTAQTTAFSSFFAAVIQNWVGADISTWVCGATPEEFKKQLVRLQNEAGLSDHFVFANVLIRDRGERFLPLGTAMDISIFRPNLNFFPPPPVLLLKKPWVDFGFMGSQIVEYNLFRNPVTATVSFVFATEKLNGQVLPAINGKPSTKMAVDTSDPLLGALVKGRLPITPVKGLGTGGLREIYLGSPANKGLLFKDRNEDCVFAFVLNEQNMQIQRIGYNVNVGDDIRVKVFIPGIHDKLNTPVLGPNRRSYTRKEIADEFFRMVELKGAGIEKTTFQLAKGWTEIWARPSKPGKISLVVRAFDGDVVFNSIATVEGASIEGLWELRNNGSRIRIVYDPVDGSYKGILEVDRLQSFTRGDTMWFNVRPSSTNYGIYTGTEVSSDGHGGSERLSIRLGLRNGSLVYYGEGMEEQLLDRVPER
ncbi:MAG: hypothetical protein JW902_19030 [Syntrophaceae bacterium]|nr:hypothetical protein [Syntrophaceae bacterium]